MMIDAPKILVVDDEPVNVKLLEVSFQKEGFKTVSATNGPGGFDLARRERPDLILLDIMMPGESGFQTCARLKENHATMDIPVIFLSAMDDLKHKVEGLTIGAVDYITKPFEKREVIARARLHIKLGRAYQALVAAQGDKLHCLKEAQRSILVKPEDLPDAGFEVFYKPIQEAGGDFFDVVRISDGIYGYLVADVSGHDLGSAFMTSAVKALFRQNVTPCLSPLETMKTINSVLHTIVSEGQHLTACYLHLNRLNSRATIISAGHPPVLFGGTNQGPPEYVHAEGDVLGPFASVYLKPIERKVMPNERFFLYTDGLIELPGSKSRIEGRKRLTEAYGTTPSKPLRDAVSSIIQNLCGEERQATDDVLLLGIEV
ncbi:MAG TPA: SpoIIE family protein phosphatase [Nitrospirota bacterium]|nr:SpoIIE family protein phosphatase [Nitrospirota bacterium]